jgi:hypothetical protein
MRRAAGRAAVLAVAVAAWSASWSRACADAIDDGLVKARRGLVSRLESIATWCNEQKLHGERDRTFRRILLLDPDHARSRAGLKFKRERKGAPWVQAPDYKEPPDWNKGLLPEAAKRRVEAALAFRVAALDVVESAGPDVPPGRREAVVELVIDVAPEDGELRRGRGDVERDGRWWLAETIGAYERRREIGKIVRSSREEAPTPVPDKKALGIGWPAAARTDRFLAYGEVTQAECVDTVTLLETSRSVMPRLFQPKEVRPWPKTTVLFPGRAAAQEFLSTKPSYADALRISGEVSGLIVDGMYVGYRSDRADRTVAALRQALDAELDMRFPSERDRGWVDEGVGQRLCWLVARRHGPSFVVLGGTEHAGAEREEEVDLPSEELDRIPAAAEVLGKDPARRVRALLTMRLNAMRNADALAAYALAAYLIEARPESLVDFLSACFASDDPEAMCRDGLGVDAETLAWRVRRWAMETASLGKK